ncbi:MAG: hypothetical protein P8100_11595 [bacterium]|jgi:hypothetical protein
MLNTLIRFYKVGKLLHFVALLALLLAVFALVGLLTQDMSDPLDFYLYLYVVVTFSIMAVMAELDGYSRFQNYKQVKDQLYFNGYQERLLKPLLRSSCQREAAVLAGTELGLGSEVKSYFHEKGYRWYHIIPDFVFQYPLFFFSLYFWRTTFFTPYYRSRVDYNQVDTSTLDLYLKGIQLSGHA